ncbi:MAG: inorganic phosphate transporter [Candidatus Methylomirabilales bacterium]
MLGWLSSGLFLGWSLGANDAANIFGTAVASRMVRSSTAATLAAVFVILGGLVNGPAAMATLSEFGQVDTLPGAFTAALAAAMVVAGMTRIGIPVSTSQAVVGALIGYRLFQHGSVDTSAWLLLRTIVVTWVACPILAAATAFLIYKMLALAFRWLPMPLLVLDRWLRFGLLAVGCYGAWALGGNNMANVVGIYARLDLFDPVAVGAWGLSQSRMLALLGGLAISLGVMTYSYRVMLTVGRDLVKLDATTALIAILAEALVVDFFAHPWDMGVFILPAIPVSTSQAMVGGVLGIGLARGIQTIKMLLLFYIAMGWLATPLISAALARVILPIVLRFA